MLEHIVLIKTLDFEDRRIRKKIIDALQELPEKISEIKSLSVGENFSERNNGFDVGLRVTFDSEEDLETYQDHADHVKVLENLIRPNAKDVLAVDYLY